MTTYRRIYENAAVIPIPDDLRNQRLEVTIRALDDVNGQEVDVQAVQPTDENGWPVGFFEATAGAWVGEPLERAPQGEYETRLSFD